MPVLLYAVIAFSLASQAWSAWLDRRHARHVLRHRSAVPEDFRGAVTLEEHQKAADYTVAKLRLGSARALLQVPVGLLWLLAGYDLLAGALSGFDAPLRDVLFVGAFAAVTSLLGLPFSAYGALVLEERFGFNRTTPALFAADTLKALAIKVMIGAPLLYGVFWTMERVSGPWWLYTWAGLVALMLAAPFVYIRLIAPLFNKFEPLTDTAARERIEGLMRRCGFEASGLFTMDASRRSSHGNAFFIGFGRTKRIVLFDTLLHKHTPEEIDAVIAHELGHFKHGHTLFGVARGAATMLVMLAAVGWLAAQPWLLPQFGFEHQTAALSLIAAVMVLGVVTPLLDLLTNWLSRRHEFQADSFAADAVGARHLISALTKLTRDSAGTLTPDPLYALVHYSHPPVPVRVAHLRSLAAPA